MPGRPDPIRIAPAVAAVWTALWVVVTCWLPGIPGFQHDWSWPFTRPQAFQDAQSAVHIWHASGLGTTSNAPNAAVVALILWSFAAAVGPLAALHLLDVLFVVVAGAGAYYFVKSWDEKASGIIAAGLYCASPVMYNKLFAGHTYYLAGIALLPWVALFATRAMKTERQRLSYAIACGVATALAAGQFQFMAICAITIGLIATLSTARFGARVLVVTLALGTAFVLHAADYIVMLQPQSGSGFASQTATLSWQVSQSVPLLNAFAQYDYIGGYARVALGAKAVTIEQVVALAIVVIALCAIFARRRAALLGLFLLSIGGLITAGTYGPFAVPLAYEVSHNGFATVFRELYNFAILTTLGTALLAGQCVVLGNRIGRFVAAAAACVVILAFALPFAWKAPATTMTVVPVSHAEEIAREANARAGRVLLLPGSPALSFGASHYHGVDSDSQAGGNVQPVTYSAAPDQYAFLFSGSASPRLLSRVGIARTVTRSDVRSDYLHYLDPYSASIAQKLMVGMHPQSERTASALAAQTANYSDVATSADVNAGIPTWAALDALPPGTHLVSEPPKPIVPVSAKVSVGVDPVHEWVQSTRWLPAIPQLACLPQPSLFRLHGTAIPPGCSWHMTEYHGTRCLTNTAGALEAVALACVYPSARALNNDDAINVVAQIKQHRAKLAYLRTAYDTRWTLYCGVTPIAAQPMLVDVYAMGWKVDSKTRCDENLRAEFSGDHQFALELCASWFFVALMWAFARRSERHYIANS